jgi:hypothetical protein
MLDRNFEYVEGSIAAFVTGSGSSAEVVARTAVESSVTVLVILAGDRQARLRSYFDHYLHEVDRQIERWRELADGLTGKDATLHAAGIEQRRAATEALRNVVEANFDPGGERWPGKLEDRFESIGESMAYRTIYSRMSSACYGDAEEILRYIVGKMSSPDILGKMALETFWMTRLYIYDAVELYLQACRVYADSYGMEGIMPLLQKEADAVQRELGTIISNVGGYDSDRAAPA